MLRDLAAGEPIDLTRECTDENDVIQHNGIKG
jgi:hypothetical protein